jgi:putative Mg2+ transporter-C (MgtC) family protein
VIFMRRDAVRGLTTAASLWLTAGVGAAAGAGLGFLALIVTIAYFLVCYGLRPLAHRLPALRSVPVTFRIEYLEGQGLLRTLLNTCTSAGFSIAGFKGTGAGTERRTMDGDHARGEAGGVVLAVLTLQGRGNPDALTAQLAGTEGVVAVSHSRDDDEYS